MKIGVLSDTHDQGELIQKAIKHFNDENVSWVFHCGDWVSPFILHFFSRITSTFAWCLWHNDGDKFRHLAFKNRWGINLEYEDRFLEMELDKRSIAVFHGDYSGIVDLLLMGKARRLFEL